MKNCWLFVDHLTTLLAESRRYCLELIPKLLPCRGQLIDLLISSGIGEHMEFQAVNSNQLYWNKVLEQASIYFLTILCLNAFQWMDNMFFISELGS